MENFILILINIFWISGFALIGIFSNAAKTIDLKTDYKRSRIGGIGYSIKEIKKAIKTAHDKDTINRLKVKIRLRKMGYWSILIGILLVFLKDTIVELI